MMSSRSVMVIMLLLAHAPGGLGLVLHPHKQSLPHLAQQFLHEQLTESSAQLSTVTQELVNLKCEDKKMMDDIGPLVGSVANFFKKKQITAYPWALTGLAASRYGGVSVMSSQENQIALDHDLDFLIQMQEATLDDAKTMVLDWQQHLLNSTGLESYDVTHDTVNEFERKNQEGWAKINNLGVHHFWIIVKQSSGVGHAMKESTFPTDFFKKVMPQPHKIHGFRGLSENIQHRNGLRRFKANIDAAFKDEWTMVDLWIKLEPLDYQGYQPSATKRMLFVGHTFPFPQDPEVIHQDLKATYVDNHKIQATKSLCELREPRGLFEEDVTPSIEMSQLVDTCTKFLDKQGYASLGQYCRAQSSSNV